MILLFGILLLIQLFRARRRRSLDPGHIDVQNLVTLYLTTRTRRGFVIGFLSCRFICKSCRGSHSHKTTVPSCQSISMSFPCPVLMYTAFVANNLTYNSKDRRKLSLPRKDLLLSTGFPSDSLLQSYIMLPWLIIYLHRPSRVSDTILLWKTSSINR